MPVLLRIDSSITRPRSASRELTGAFADAWTARGADHTVVERDLGAHPVPHLPDAALHWPPRLRPAGATPPADAEALQDELIDELLAADALLVGAPMYNYSLPSALKAWLDHVHVPARTAPFDVQTQPLAGRPAVVVSSRGAAYDTGTPTETWDHTVPPLEILLGSALGMRVEVVTTSLTLADSVPALAGLRDRAHAEFAAATERLRVLATDLQV